ncbi:type I-F CRISPR-associated protein Csy3 [Enterovibrio paralichthyis]|uniref:type I-F CRISPR-associated protein Csy3 n=1 Tax=Enterovibrio paralichthyis TaxID=2853805 RepID=UPI001C48D86B|nr:type I-F CRISPR-associated protein Csy3 [Enterovibrio paralichthyis]MBV7297713.1 type I-F CRISPR-associated protein Csy3 [Enterovibrio paralichthyis]
MEIPYKFSYERSIEPSDVCFLAVWPDEHSQPLPYDSRTALGMREGMAAAYTQSGQIDPNATEEYLAQGNPHELHFCSVPYGVDHIRCEFSVTFLPELRKPNVCSERAVHNTMIEFVKLYESKVGWTELVSRYLFNICTGKWIWRNAKKAYSLDIEIKYWPSNGQRLNFHNTTNDYPDIRSFEDSEHWHTLVNLIIAAFSTPQTKAILEVNAYLKLPRTTPFYPSQAYKDSKKRENNRIYQSTLVEGENSPIIGFYKTGAAIAMIDDWYPDAEDLLRVSHYGVHKQDVTCYRHPSTGKDFFSLLQRTEEYVEILASNAAISQEALNDMHFMMASLIKGGMFQKKRNES